jgi:hypothetical protein
MTGYPRGAQLEAIYADFTDALGNTVREKVGERLVLVPEPPPKPFIGMQRCPHCQGLRYPAEAGQCPCQDPRARAAAEANRRRVHNEHYER